jgi:hypothetical protein
MYPPDLKEVIIEAFRGLDERNKPYEFPSSSHLSEMLEATYLASLQREESRQLEFRLGYCNPDHLSYMANLSPQVHWMPFDSPRPCSDSELKRLSPAVDPGRSMICCYGQNQLKLVGVLTAHSDYSKLTTRSVLHGRMLPDVFNVSTSSPGELCANRGDASFVHLKCGKLRFPKALTRDDQLLSDLIPIEAKLEEDAWNSIEPRDRPQKGSYKVMLPYFPFIAHLLYTMDRSRHGGSLLIVPHESANSLDDKTIRIKYRLKDVSAWLVCRDWVAQLLSHVNSGRKLNTFERKSHNPYSGLDEKYRSIMLMAESLGDLGRVDGAVIITDRLEIIGFGAEISCHQEAVTNVRFHPDAKTACRIESVEANGTRHRSVIRFCSAIAGATGFVLSQDGGMKMVRKGSHGVEMWGDVVPSF